jgi:hypothetical protein
MKTKSTWPLVAVHWRDAYDGTNGWTEVKHYEPEQCTVVTVGWLWEGCLDGYITLVGSYMPDEIEDPKTVGMPVHIPVGMVIETFLLEQPMVSLPWLDQKQEESTSEMLHASSSGHRPFQGRPLDVSNLPKVHHELFRNDI